MAVSFSKVLSALFVSSLFATGASAQDAPPPYPASILGELSFRSIGPALTSGRLSDLAVYPVKEHIYYLAAASGGVWKTQNGGTTFTPVFDEQNSYSIGCLALAPSNPHTVWVGTGENNNQRSVGYGDGVYKSVDDGVTWKNMGLKDSEHIGMIAIHPKDERVVYVAAYGPLWSAGGDRGIYKTTDGGDTWERVLSVSEHTGFNEIHMDPRDPEVLYATAHQRRRHVYTYIDGGPESAIYKSVDGGKNWRKLTVGLPKGDLGRIGMDISPANPDVVFAIIAATEGGGFYRSDDRGEHWKKMSDHQTSGNYYQEIVCHPEKVDVVFSMDTWLHHTEDGGKTFKMTGEKNKHVDNHCMWIDPHNTDHWLVGCDGGLYETWNAAADWEYYDNLPITQFYKVEVDRAEPFYNVYGGTQDNNTQGGPSQTLTVHGIRNSDWFITNGGDGFEVQVDPENPNIVYGQAQYGWLVRYDKQSGERVPIQPVVDTAGTALRWNWDAPLIISPHDHRTLYFAANVLFKSTDRGNNWQPISPDLSRQLDRNALPVMGRVWGPDAVAKNESTSIYGNITALSESPQVKGLLYAGTDDGLIQVSENDGATWKRIESFGEVPPRTYVNFLLASQHDQDRVYAAFNNHKNGDFKPYILSSADRGRTWTSISANLPARGSVYCLAEDHIDPQLLFAGTEFGVFFTKDGGKSWSPLSKGLPTIAVRDMEIQRRENDLVLATFGRGFYILDNYAALRNLNKDITATPAHIFEVPPGKLYVQSNPIGLRDKGHMGASFYTAPNPPFGAVFTFYVRDSLSTLKEQRQAREAQLVKQGKPVVYPSIESLRAEDREEKPYLMLVIKDSQGEVVRKIRTAGGKGLQRESWNLRHESTAPIRLEAQEPGRYSEPEEGMLVVPGTYQVELYRYQNESFTLLAGPLSFEVEPLNNQSLLAADPGAVLNFQEQVAELQRSLLGTQQLYKENSEKLTYLEKAVETFPTVPLTLEKEIAELEDLQYRIGLALNGDATRASHEFETMPGISDRVAYAAYATWWNTAEPTGTAREQYAYARSLYAAVLEDTKRVAARIAELEKQLVALKVPYTPGRGEDWGRD